MLLYAPLTEGADLDEKEVFKKEKEKKRCLEQINAYSNLATSQLRALSFVSNIVICTFVRPQVRVSDAVTELELERLIPHTEYTVTVYAMYGEEAGDPVSNQETTCKLCTCTRVPFFNCKP